MSTLTPPVQLTPKDVERASVRDGKLYELIGGELKEKRVGFWELFTAQRIIERLNQQFYPHEGAAAGEVMVYCFKRANHGRKPDVVYVRNKQYAEGRIAEGDIYVVPHLVVEVLSPNNTGLEVDDKLEEYLEAGIPLVWIVNRDRRTIRVYRSDGTTHLFKGQDVIENEPLLPGFRLVAADVFPAP
ncbi:MAG TPA: Uma2 family endonuclease [Tepidisphaeraceae bacterium]|jgi:Uma2 family endonuclease